MHENRVRQPNHRASIRGRSRRQSWPFHKAVRVALWSKVTFLCISGGNLAWSPLFLHHVAPASSALAADGQANLRGPTLCTALQARLTYSSACRVLKALASHLWEE